MNVSEMRARFGALQNRLQSTINNLGITVENQEAANSRIRDADIAIESSRLAKDSVLQQAAAAVLATSTRGTSAIFDSSQWRHWAKGCG